MAFLSLSRKEHLLLGIDTKSAVALRLSLFVASVIVRTGRTIVMHGIVLRVVYRFTVVVP